MSFTIILDSSNTSLTVGISKDNQLLDFTSYEAWQAQSEHMIPELHALLEKHHVSKDDIKEIIVTRGPGSYTGVRIAITIAKVLAVALPVKLYAISSLHALKDGDNKSICLINARSGRSYVGVYQGKNVIIKDTIWTNDEVIKYIENNQDISICGNVNYLKLEGINTNIALECLSLKEEHYLVDNPLLLKPVYMKD